MTTIEQTYITNSKTLTDMNAEIEALRKTLYNVKLSASKDFNDLLHLGQAAKVLIDAGYEGPAAALLAKMDDL